MDDLKQLREFRQTLLHQHKVPKWAIIGGGLIGCELASDIAISGEKVTIYHTTGSLMERQLVANDSARLLEVLQATGVEVLLNQHVQNIQQQGDKTAITLHDKAEKSLFDGVIVCCGFKPRTAMAKRAGLNVARGILVNQYLQTSNPNIYTLGDAAELPNGKLYAFILPIRSQALWLSRHLAQIDTAPWSAPSFKAKAKVQGFQAEQPSIF